MGKQKMKTLICAVLVLVPNVAFAQFSLDTLVGKWSGQGTYAENMSSAKMRCKIDFAGGADKVTMTGRCASGLGAQKVALDLVQSKDGSITAKAAAGAPENKTEIDGLTGLPTERHLVMDGVAGEDSIKMEFLMNADGSLRFGVHSIIGPKDGKSVIRLIRQ
jgi:hypothetical protein